MNAKTPPEPPQLSLSERDRRWSVLRAAMREHGYDSLLVASFRAREMFESYITDDYNEGCVVFPLEGDPVIITWANLRVMRARWSRDQGHALWVEDYRVATSGTSVAQVFADKGLDRRRIGVVGLSSQAPTEIYGAIPANFWLQFTAALPHAVMEDFSDGFSHLMLPKSAEELAQVRYAAQAAETACEVIARIAEPGVGEEVIYAEALREISLHGLGMRYPCIVMNSGPHTLSWGPPRWTTRAERPRVLQNGDLLQIELMPTCGNQEIQVQMAVALGDMDEKNLTCEKTARDCYDAGLAALKPGISFADLVTAMEQPLKGAGCWAYTPLVHSVAPHFLTGRSRVNLAQANLNVPMVGAPAARDRHAVLQEGMVFSFEPNACIDEHRVNIGGTVIVTASGCEELNRVPTRVTHK